MKVKVTYKNRLNGETESYKGELCTGTPSWYPDEYDPWDKNMIKDYHVRVSQKTQKKMGTTSPEIELYKHDKLEILK